MLGIFISIYWYYVSGIFSIYRYDVPGIHGMNFVLPNVLGGGGVASLRSDPQVITQCFISMWK